jgi:hypothetical protein
MTLRSAWGTAPPRPQHRRAITLLRYRFTGDASILKAAIFLTATGQSLPAPQMPRTASPRTSVKVLYCFRSA